MENVKEKKERKRKIPKGLPLFIKMIEDRRVINNYLRKGKSLDELKEKGYVFGTI